MIRVYNGARGMAPISESFNTLKEAIAFRETFSEQDQRYVMIDLSEYFPESTGHEGACFVPPNKIELYNEGGYCSTAFTLDQVINFMEKEGFKKVENSL